ncbi:MAG: methyltransferase domain-containing protein [Candidatus Eisenbacteria bacterium]|uniref:Methyltransferase domain-containing protein n=1 Tax=Eiseniibacteriota bacterium TaxID=2212470 RepID=A0A933SDU0_UNCEI|nr:methyltransferase domain-containing protein [Candidatus Eisenbacteria bacterium]
MSDYDTIGKGYAGQRRPDPRIAARLAAALGGARTVLNVGAGAGSYEPADRQVVALEPSRVMLAQRAASAAAAVQGRAEALPFADRAFDATMAVLTLHHWADRADGLAECARVARERVVLLTFDAFAEGFWLVRDYFPEFLELDRRQFPPVGDYATLFAGRADVEIASVPVPRDCVDGFLGAYWARPEAYLDPAVRAGISSFARCDTAAGLERLRADLASGAWHARNGELLERDALDLGYRLVVATLAR